jgi:hypothetical protein
MSNNSRPRRGKGRREIHALDRMVVWDHGGTDPQGAVGRDTRQGEVGGSRMG